MGARVPAVATAEAVRSGLGRFKRRYRFRRPGSTFLGAGFSAFGVVMLLCRAPWFVTTVALLVGVPLLTYAVLMRVHAGFYLYEKGLVQVGPSRRVRFATRWSEVEMTGSSLAVVRYDRPPAEVMWYVVIRRDGQRAEFGVTNLHSAPELFAAIASRGWKLPSGGDGKVR